MQRGDFGERALDAVNRALSQDHEINNFKATATSGRRHDLAVTPSSLVRMSRASTLTRITKEIPNSPAEWSACP
jgi:hypothetical protein